MERKAKEQEKEEGSPKKQRREIEQGKQEAEESTKAPTPEAPSPQVRAKGPTNKLTRNATCRKHLPEKSGYPMQTKAAAPSHGEEERGEIQPEPIDTSRLERPTGPYVRMKFRIAESQGELGRNRYVEKQRSSQTIEIICGPEELNDVFHDMVNEPAQETLRDLGMAAEVYYGVTTQYMGRYL